MERDGALLHGGMCKKDSTLEGRKEQTLGCPNEEDFRQEKSL